QLSEVGNERLVRERALALATATATYLPQFERQLSIGVAGLRRVREFALGQGASGFVQVEAMGLLVALLGSDVVGPLEEVLADTRGRDATIARYGALGQVLRARIPQPQKLELLWRVRSDESEHVRQGLARALRQLAAPLSAARLAEMVRDEPSERVAAVALLELDELARRDESAVELLNDVLAFGLVGHSLVRRAALQACSRRQSGEGSLCVDRLRAAMQELIEGSPVELAERGALLARSWECRHEVTISRCEAMLREQVETLEEGGTRTVDLPQEASIV